MPETKSGTGDKLVLWLSVGTILVMLFNIYLAFGFNSQLGAMAEMHNSMATAYATGAVANTSAGTGNAASGDSQKIAQIMESVIPKGTPDVYGAELGVSFDDPVNSLNKLAKLDGDLYPDGEIKFADLTPEQQQSYVRVGQSIACEYCCGATTMVQRNGMPACGCAHSAAMRGVVKYLLKNHPGEYTDEQLLTEAAKWKALSFPKQTVEKALQFAAESGEISGASVAGLPSQVGGC